MPVIYKGKCIFHLIIIFDRLHVVYYDYHVFLNKKREQYKNVEKQHVEHLKELAQQDKLDVIARAKKLTIETNKRRR